MGTEADSSSAGREIIYRHTGTVRATHWVNVVCLLVLLMSGLQIFNANPALYLGSKSTFDDPVMAMRPMTHGDEMMGITTLFGWNFDTTGCSVSPSMPTAASRSEASPGP